MLADACAECDLTGLGRAAFTAGMRLYDYAASANCFKVRLLLALLGVRYDRVPVDIFAGETLTDAYAALNPARETPVLELDDGRVLPDSAAILAFVAEGTPYLPEDAFERAQVLRWLVYEQTAVVPAIGGLRFRLLTGRLAAGEPEAARRHEAGLEVLALLDAELAARPFLVGARPTIADVAAYGYVHVADEAGYALSAFPSVVSWLARVAALPGFVSDLEPYPPNARPGAGRSIYD
jgi:glutathione S-transferase